MRGSFLIITIFSYLFTNTPGHTASKLQLNLANINASLDEGFGGVSMDEAAISIDPINVNLEKIDYDLSMKENFFLIEGNGQTLKLDLRSFKKIFEQQKFNAINTDISIKQGEYINIDSEYFDVVLQEVKLNFFGPKISCAPDVGRDITEEILSLCLKKSSIELPRGVLSGREDIVYQWASKFFNDQKIEHLPKFARPVLTNGIASIDDGKILIRADLKILFNMQLSGTGFVEHQSKENIISLRIDTLASKTINLKKPVLKLLKLIENNFFSLDGDILVFNLEEMRAQTP